MTGQHSGPVEGRSTKQRLTFVLFLSATYLVAEVIGGLATGSLALLADAGHMLTDVAGLALALLAVRFSEKQATAERTYGFYRGEILAAMANAIVLIAISIYILYEAYGRFRNPPEIASGLVLIVAGIGLAINVAGVLILRGGARSSLNLKGAYFEVVSDLLSSLAVIVAAGVMWSTGWYYADPLVSAGIGLFILPRTWGLLREAIGVLLEGTPSGINLAAVRDTLEQVPGVRDVHDLHVWSLTSGYNAMSVHLLTADDRGRDAILSDARAAVKREFDIRHVTIQVELARCLDTEVHE